MERIRNFRRKGAGKETAGGYGIKVYAALCACTFFVCWMFCLRRGMFGGKVDWISQHSVLPDYFRRQFYETGNLFPEFAAHIGGGQNIYNFSYYGLLSPAVVLSYLFPSVEMPDYLMAAQFVSLTVSVAVLYWWLSGCRAAGCGFAGKSGEGSGLMGSRFDRKVCLFTAVIFLVSGPMVYHSYNQIMFVNYMPFLCLGFAGVDRHFAKKKSGLLTVSVFLMIMSSFYFSIGGMLALGLYGLSRYVREWEDGRLNEGAESRAVWAKAQDFFREGARFLVPFFVAVLMGGVLLIPTAMAMSGREGSVQDLAVSSLLIPEFSVERFFYSPYGIGMTTLSFTALLSLLLFGRCWERVLAFGYMLILTVPFFSFLLNGGLYVRDKVMIPFLPLLCYVTADYVSGLESAKEAGERKREVSVREGTAGKGGRRFGVFKGALPYAATLSILCIHVGRHGTGRYGKYVLADALVMLLCYMIFSIRKNVLVLLAPPVLLLGLSGNSYHLEAGTCLDKEFFGKVTDVKIGELIEEAAESEEGLYRTEQLGTAEENAANLNRIWNFGQYISSLYSSLYNEGYRNFRREFGAEEPYRNFLMQTAVQNPVFRRFMGVKYLVADVGEHKEIPGYSLKEAKGDWGIFENQSVSPVIYATDRVMGSKVYESLSFPENQLSLLSFAVVEKGSGKETETGGKAYAPAEIVLPGEINSKKPETFTADIRYQAESLNRETDKGSGPNRVVFLRFRVENLKPYEDVAVWTEGQRNKLTSKGHFYYNAHTVFTYAVPVRQDQNRLELVFGEGHYRVSDVQCFLGALPSKEEAGRLYQSEYLPDQEKTRGNVTAGDIEVKNTGYLITAIPYDEHFELFVDGKKVKTEKVNTAFLGCRIDKGRHEVEIVYHAPGMKAGKMVSAIGFFLFLGMNAVGLKGTLGKNSLLTANGSAPLESAKEVL